MKRGDQVEQMILILFLMLCILELLKK